MRRTGARESFMQMLFEMDVQNDFSRQRMEQFQHEFLEKKPEEEYFDRAFAAIEAHKDEIDQVIAGAVTHWSLDRVDKVDLAILRLAVAEMRYIDSIPQAVSINEAVELAKRFGTEESGKFVNGVLGTIARA